MTKDEKKEYNKKWRDKNKEYIKQQRLKNKDKMKIYSSEYRKINKEKIKERLKTKYIQNKDYFKKYSAEQYKTKKEAYKKRHDRWYCTMHGKFCAWKRSAKYRNLEFSITEEYLVSLPQICAYTGQELTFERNKPNTISLDRIDSSKGYIEGNVQFVCTNINYSKSDMSEQEFIEMCELVTKYKRNSRLAN